MHQFIFIILILISYLKAHSQNTDQKQKSVCQQAFHSFQKRFSKLEKKYAEITDQKILTENKPSWAWGHRDEAVYLLHGFIGTPEEMNDLAQKLKEKNFTVINDLIPGHGTNGFVANQFNQDTWVQHVEANLNSIRQCFEHVHLVGFSTGGLLVHDYVRRHEKDFQARSMTLFSPFYKANLAFSNLLTTAARLVTPVVLTQPLYCLTHFPDIKVAVLKPQNYLQELPLDTARFVEELGLQVNTEIHEQPLVDNQTPVLVFVSDSDQIINLNITLKNLQNDFTNLFVVRFRQNQIPHHLMVKAVSSAAEQIQNKSLQFILKNSASALTSYTEYK